MRINLKKTGLVVGTLAAATMLIAPAAFAANVVSVNGVTSGPNVSASGTNVGTITFVTDYGITTTCNASAVTGYVTPGASTVAGTKIGAISTQSFSSCTVDGGLPVVVEKNTNAGAPAEWGIYVTSTPAKGQNVANIEIRGVSAKLHSTTPVTPTTANRWNCDLGATATAIPGTFNQSTQRLAFTTAAGAYPLNLTAYNGLGTKTALGSSTGTCAGQIYTGDKANMSGVFNLTTVGTGVHF